MDRQNQENRRKDFQTIYSLIALIGKQNQEKIIENFIEYLEEQVNKTLVAN